MAVILPIVTKFSDVGIRKAQSAFGGLGKSIGTLAGAAGVAVGLGAIVSTLKESTMAAAADVKSQKLLALQLKTTTNATAKQVAQTEDFIGKLSLASGIMDDNLRPALANAVRGTGSLEKGQKLLAIALDGAAASGKPVETVMAALIRANNGNTTALYKLAPQLKKTKGNIDDFAASVKGAAEAGADPFDRFAVTIDSIKEKLGMVLLPIMNKLVGYLQVEVLPRVSKFLDEIQNPKTEIGKAWVDLQTTIKGIVAGFGDFFAQFSENGNAIEGLINVMNSILKALPALLALKGIMALAAAGKGLSTLVAALTSSGVGGGGVVATGATPGKGKAKGKGGLGNLVGAPLGLNPVGLAVGSVLMTSGSTQQMTPEQLAKYNADVARNKQLKANPLTGTGAFLRPAGNTNITVNVAPGTDPQSTANALVKLLGQYDSANGTNIVKKKK
jgi:hypothetical protein